VLCNCWEETILRKLEVKGGQAPLAVKLLLCSLGTEGMLRRERDKKLFSG